MMSITVQWTFKNVICHRAIRTVVWKHLDILSIYQSKKEIWKFLEIGSLTIQNECFAWSIRNNNNNNSVLSLDMFGMAMTMIYGKHDVTFQIPRFLSELNSHIDREVYAGFIHNTIYVIVMILVIVSRD